MAIANDKKGPFLCSLIFQCFGNYSRNIFAVADSLITGHGIEKELNVVSYSTRGGTSALMILYHNGNGREHRQDS